MAESTAIVVRKWPVIAFAGGIAAIHLIAALVLIFMGEPMFGTALFLPALALAAFALIVGMDRLVIDAEGMAHHFPFQPPRRVSWADVRGVKVGGATDANSRVPMVNVLDAEGRVLLRFDRPAFLPGQWERLRAVLAERDLPLREGMES